ncbi:hypothetical protein [Acidicapsa acidisoli]|uniref:hypothetical protein n=1 Tax=Acidicapsa acidisoli TaxID=1615681 RepID=UPI0021E06690|nr:hypothetical protein [Acidicapsa acidisoli]
MSTIQNAEQAKEFLISRILAEAKREGIEFTKVEEGMLAYSANEQSQFSALNQAFEDDSNEVWFEETVASLIRNLLQRDGEDHASWEDASSFLAEDDHYLLVMIEMAKTTRPSSPARPRYDRLKLIATAAAIVALSMVLMVIFSRG